jgi:antitoxin MazE
LYKHSHMQTTIQKWGNSLAVRIPGTYVKEVGLKEGLPVSFVVENGTLIIKPVEKKYFLKDVLVKINVNNLHCEVQTGEPTGNEQLLIFSGR